MLLILREAVYGETRFDGFVEALGIARNTLSDRLGRLVDAGLLERRAYQTDPVRHDYVLTDKGRDFFGVLAGAQHVGRPVAGGRRRGAGHPPPRAPAGPPPEPAWCVPAAANPCTPTTSPRGPVRAIPPACSSMPPCNDASRPRPDDAGPSGC